MIEETEFDFESRIVSTEASAADNDVEINLRPKAFDEYIGQEKVKEMLKVYIDYVPRTHRKDRFRPFRLPA